MILPYAQFCDFNGLKRIDASLEDHMSNLDKMALAIEDHRKTVRHNELVRRLDDVKRNMPNLHDRPSEFGVKAIAIADLSIAVMEAALGIETTSKGAE